MSLTLLYSFLKKNKITFFIFLFSIAVIQGISFTMMNNYTESISPDALNYIELSKGNFNINPIQKYRIVIPMLAAGIDAVFGGIFEKIKPWSFDGDFSLFVSFWIVNTFVMALFSTATFLLCRAYAISIRASIIGLLALLTCRWTAYMAGLPLVDSLFCLVSVLSLVGIKSKNNSLIVVCILIGPWAKESFIFVAPVIFFFSSMNKFKQLGWFLLSGILVFSFRIYFDQYTGTTLTESIQNDVGHLENLVYAFTRLFSIHGVYELFSVLGLWIFIPIYRMVMNFSLFKSQLKSLDWYLYAYVGCVFVQAIISSELARMFYLALPVFVVYISKIIDSFLPTLKGAFEEKLDR